MPSVSVEFHMRQYNSIQDNCAVICKVRFDACEIQLINKA